jgi:putative SOS response-associated peptidase YedK
MARKYVLGSSLEVIKGYFNVGAAISKEWNPPIIVSPGEYSLILTQQDPGELMLSSFGMTPSRAKQPMQILNARAEGDKNPGNDPAFRGSKAIFLKPAFQKPLFSQRCIIIADAFIEWSGDTRHQPYLFFLTHYQRPVGLAGMYDVWKDYTTGDFLHSFIIITVPGNSLIRKINVSRMPVILPRGKEGRWLKPTNSLTEILGMLNKFPSDLMDAYPLNKEVDQPGPYNKDLLISEGERLFSASDLPFISRSKYHHTKKKSDVSHWLGNTPI